MKIVELMKSKWRWTFSIAIVVPTLKEVSLLTIYLNRRVNEKKEIKAKSKIYKT